MKHYLLFALSLLVFTGLQASPNKRQKALPGVWQQVQVSKHDGHTIHLPVWKVMQNDGTFCTFLIASQKGTCIITNEGRYEVTSDSTFVEYVTGSITDPSLIGRGNKITYHFSERDKIEVSYRLPGAKRDGRETWVRVKLEVPEEE